MKRIGVAYLVFRFERWLRWPNRLVLRQPGLAGDGLGSGGAILPVGGNLAGGHDGPPMR